MNFNNLTNEQIEWLEEKIKDAYEEGYQEGYYEHQGDYDVDTNFSESLAKNQTCHTLATRFMKPSDFNFDIKDLLPEDYVEPLSQSMYDTLFKGKF